MKNPLILILSGLALHSCTPRPIDVDVPPHETRLVVSSQVIPGSILVVSLTRSFSALSDAKEGDSVKTDFLSTVLVDSAVVTVSYSGQTDTLYGIVPGIYASINTLQQAGTIYTLRVKTPSGNVVSATSAMLPQVRFDTVYPVLNLSDPGSPVSMHYTIKDPPGENWYMINYYLKFTDTTKAGLDVNTYFSRGSNKLLSDFELVSDKAYEGGVITKTTVLPGVRETDTIAVTVSNISKGYFSFLTAYKRTGNFINQLAAEPIDFPTNVNNGLGFFNTHYPDVRYFYLKEHRAKK
jgi:hypothetical protein